MRGMPLFHSIKTASTSAVLTPESLPTAVAAPAPAEIDSEPQAIVPAIELAPFTESVQVPGQKVEPSSQALADVPVIANCPVLLLGAQMSRFQHARSPTGHQADPGQLASPVGAWAHGAANQV